MSPIHFCASSYRFRDIKIFNLLPPKSKSRSRSANFAITPFDGKCKKNYKCLPHIFALALTVSDIKKRPPQVGQGHGVQFWQLHH